MLTNKGYRNIIKSIEIVNVRFESETPDTRYSVPICFSKHIFYTF